VADDFRVCAERELEFQGRDSGESRKVVVRIGVPEHDGTRWRCPTQLVGAPQLGDVFFAYGEDSLQALQLALDAIAIRLRALGNGGVLTWDGEPGIGIREPDPMAGY
jgi:hypothetical protein